jgi:LysM repeat protein
MTAITFGSGPSVQAPRLREPRLRLTRRGRVVFTTLAAAPLVAIAVFLGLGGGDAVAGQATTAGVTAAGATFTYVSVAPGQSLWQLAEQFAPHADPREVVADILALNQLRSADVQPGQELAIPTQYAGSQK